MHKIEFHRQAIKDSKKLKRANLDKKAKQLIEILKIDPFQSPPYYETLVGNLSGFYSRRINLQHRLVYKVIEEEFTEDGIQYDGIVRVLRMWSHYE